MAKANISKVDSLPIKNLFEECTRFAKAIYNQQQNSEYKNKYNEKKFSNVKELQIQVGDFNVSVLGYIDRVDVKDDKFALIDYKTGADKFSYTDLVSGRKIQLLVYVKAVNAMTGLIPVCACYLPIKNDFKVSADDINSYKFKGVFTNSLNELMHLEKYFDDKSKSNLCINITTKNEIDSNSKPYALSSDDILKLSDVAFDLVKQAVNDIVNGDISIRPLYDGETACKRCSYSGICNFNREYGDKYRFVNKAKTFDEVLESKNKNE